MLEVIGELLTWTNLGPREGDYVACGRFDLSRLTQFVHHLLPQFPHLRSDLCNKISHELNLTGFAGLYRKQVFCTGIRG